RSPSRRTPCAPRARVAAAAWSARRRSHSRPPREELPQRPVSFDPRGEDFLHEIRPAATRRRIQLTPAVGPDRIGHAAERHESLVVPLLIAVVDPLAGKNAVAVVLVR